MNVAFECTDKVNGLMTITVEEADYKENVEKALKQYRKKANMPGFRPGMVPMGMIKRQYGMPAKMDAINKLVSDELYKYIKDNKIDMLGEPLPSSTQVAVDLEKEAPYVFAFDIAIAPEFDLQLTSADTVEYNKIAVDDAIINRQVQMYASRQGSYVKADLYDPEKNDMLKGDIRELDAEGNTLEGGITLDTVSMMPKFIKVEEQKALFDGAKPGDIITFNPTKAYPDNDAEVSSMLKIDKAEVANHKGDFSYQVTEISRYEPHAIDQELFDEVYGKDAVNGEEEFRQRVAQDLEKQFVADSDFGFFRNLRKYCEQKVGELTFPDELLKRVMKNANKDKGDEYVERNYEGSVKELAWQMMQGKLAAAADIKLEDADVLEAAKEATRAQFAQYGMNNIPDDYVENYAKEMLKKREQADALLNRAMERKLTEAMKSVVTLDEKTVTLDEFNKMMSE